MPDHRILKNRYKQTFVSPGVFVIRNTADQRVYLDGSLHPEAAMNRHRFELTTRKHRHKALQADWLVHGATAFRFELLASVRQSERADFDYAAELSDMLALWHDELARTGTPRYKPVAGAMGAAYTIEAAH